MTNLKNTITRALTNHTRNDNALAPTGARKSLMEPRIGQFIFALAAASVGFVFTATGAGFADDGAATYSWSPFVETNFPFFSSVVDARTLGKEWPTNNLTPRGLILNFGHEGWACFDTELLRMSVIWIGKGLTPVSMSQISYHSPGTKAKEGEEILPQIVGSAWLANGLYPGWQMGERISLADPRDPGPDAREIGRGPLSPSAGRFKAIRMTHDGCCLEYSVAGASLREWVEASVVKEQPIVQRRFHLERVPQPLWLVLGNCPDSVAEQVTFRLVVGGSAGHQPAVELINAPDGLRAVRVPASDGPVEFTVAMGTRASIEAWRASSAERRIEPPNKLWSSTLTTRALLSRARDAYVVDSIPLPTKNPWRRNVRLADLAFFRDGRAVAVTFDGDVWVIAGLSGDLTEVRWQRFASGLHEPLGLCIRHETVFVFDRNGIWRLRDTDGNGEADVHELFSNAFTQTAETREYAHGIRAAPDGSFIIAKGGIQMSALGKHNGSVLRVAPDGNSVEVLGRGLRSPFIGVHPQTGLITASDQQGYYVPTTPLHIISGGNFYGFLSNLLPREQYPAPIADPLTWIPYPINASGSGQVWLVGGKMGPLNDALAHIGYFRPEVFAVLLNHRTPRAQAAVVSLTRDLEFAPLNGAVNPSDGQLYVTGFQIFGTTAKQLSGLARVRYTGAPSTLPREVIPMDRGVLLRFDVPLNASAATNPANFSAERWNYQRTAAYGSPHFKPDGTKGQEAMVSSSAYLSRDGKSVFVAFPNMKPVMQMRAGWTLTASDGTRLEQSAYFTPYELTRFDPVAEGFEASTVNLTPRSIRPTLAAQISVNEGRRVSELMGCVACHSTDGSTVGKVGPTWKGLAGSEVLLADGNTVRADEVYLRESIVEPAAKMVRSYDKSDTSMPSYEGLLSNAQIESLILYLKTLR